MKNLKRLLSMLKGQKWLIVFSIICIIIVQVLGFISPLLVKQVLDDGILGIEYEWVETSNVYEKSVEYGGRNLIQLRHLDNEDDIIKNVSIIIIKNHYYFAEGKVVDGKRVIESDTLTVTTKDATIVYPVTKLSSEEVKKFYAPISKTLMIFIILIGIRSVLSILFQYINSMCINKTVNNLARNGRTKALEACERLPISYFEEEPTGKMANRIIRDVDGLIRMYRLIMNTFFTMILSFCFAYVGMFILDPKLALLSFLIYPFAALWIFIYLKFLKGIVEKVNESRSLLTAKINEIINGISILKIFNFKKRTLDEYNEINQNYTNEQLAETKLHLVGGWNLVNVLNGIITAIIVLYFGLQRLTFGGVVVTAGIIYAYNEYLLKVISPIYTMFTQIGEFQHSNVQIERIFKLIEGTQEDDEFEVIPKYKGDVKFDNVWFAYNDKDYVLKGVSFDIEAGKMLAIVGHTGSGKSTLMNLLLRFYDIDDPLSGKVYVDDCDITTYSKRTYRQHIGIVLQEPVLFKGTIASNIRFGKTDVSDEEVENVLRRIGGGHIIDKYPDGINQNIRSVEGNLSVGEKQLISLARVLVQDPAILVMDEATSHIDTETETIIKHALKVVCENRTVIVIAHRLSTIYNADKIVVLNHGLKVEEGKHDELVKANGYYANIYRSQTGVISKKLDI